MIAVTACLPYSSWPTSLSHAIDSETLRPIFLYWDDALRAHEERLNRLLGSEYHLFRTLADRPGIRTINSNLLVSSVSR